MQIVYESDALCHYGILGMKWGHRRATKKANKSQKLFEKSQKLAEKSFTVRDRERAARKKQKSDRLFYKSKKKADKALKIIEKIKKSEKTLSKMTKEDQNTILKGSEAITKQLSENTPWIEFKKRRKTQGVISLQRDIR